MPSAPTYSGDGNYLGVTSGCEPLSVQQGLSLLSTTVHDAATDLPLTGALPLDAKVYDTVTLTHARGPTPTGTVTYTFYRAGDCTTGTVVGTQVVKVGADGSVPNSATSAPLTAATSPYAYEATYSGDANYVGGASACEPFSVRQGPSSLSTTVHNAKNQEPVTGPVPSTQRSTTRSPSPTPQGRHPRAQ